MLVSSIYHRIPERMPREANQRKRVNMCRECGKAVPAFSVNHGHVTQYADLCYSVVCRKINSLKMQIAKHGYAKIVGRNIAKAV